MGASGYKQLFGRWYLHRKESIFRMPIPRGGNLYRVWFTTKAGQTVFEGYVLGDEDRINKILKIYTFIYDPTALVNKLIEQNGELKLTYYEADYLEPINNKDN